MSEPYLIGICGPSGSGKSALAGLLGSRLPAAVLPLDAYYRDLTHLPPALRDERNFDHPDAIDHDLLLRHVRALAAGAMIERPVYDFGSHTRTAERRVVIPTRFVIAEGLFTLHWAALRALFSFTVYLDLDDAQCLTRRLERDIRERGRDAGDVRRRFARTVQPMCERYVRPGRAIADLVLSGELTTERAGQLVLDRVGEDRAADREPSH